MDNTLAQDVKKLEKYILNLPKAKHLNAMNRAERDAMLDLRDSVSLARENIVLYSVSDDSDVQAKALDKSVEHIQLVNDKIMFASQYDLLGPVDVAHLSALAESIKERL